MMRTYSTVVRFNEIWTVRTRNYSYFETHDSHMKRKFTIFLNQKALCTYHSSYLYHSSLTSSHPPLLLRRRRSLRRCRSLRESSSLRTAIALRGSRSRVESRTSLRRAPARVGCRFS